MTIRELEDYSPASFYDLRDQLKQLVYTRSHEAFSRGNADRDAINDIEGLKKRQDMVRESFIRAIGGLPGSDTPLNAEITGTAKFDGYRVEKLVFEARPEVYVTANLYIPDGIESPGAAVLFLCGHSSQGKQYAVYHEVCQCLVRSGLVVMAQDPVGQGERFSYYEDALGKAVVGECTEEHAYAGCQCLPVGYPSARYFLHDAMRGIDYLSSRPEVDPCRIGVTGNSGGGTQTCMVMMADTRIAAAAPGTFLTSRQENIYTGLAQDSEQNWPGMSEWGFDHEDILVCMVPRPVAVLAVEYDFFPIEGTRKSVERTRRFWQMYGKEENLRLFEDCAGHKYTTKLAKDAAGFFTAVLNGNKKVPDGEIMPLEEPGTLWCTKSGQIRGEKPAARFIFEENLDRLQKVRKNRESKPDGILREEALRWLSERVFHCRKPADANVRHIAEWHIEELAIESSVWWSQERVLNHALSFRNIKYAGQVIPATVAVWDGGTAQLQSHMNWICKTCRSGRLVMVLNTSGVGAIKPNPLGSRDVQGLFGAVHKLCDDLMWLGDSMAALRTYDVLRAVEALKNWRGVNCRDIQLYAYGRQGVYTRFAAFLDECIGKVVVEEGMESYSQWVGERFYDAWDIMSIIIPGMLKFFDLPDIDRWTGKVEKI